ncbi:acyl-CoA dehydrogenase family protein [Cellulosilyticum ruminicola]|uniref:acyl-CoA dehydrogenase family protein n=1 Tax=Cellulosilyticum ruminicola TaxID=425254 RepID=UPI0006D28630|nr:acyl-CoA dehydrogenase family protein [Cellulosilyticum ruminicola]
MQEIINKDILPYINKENCMQSIFEALGKDDLLGISSRAYNRQDQELLEKHKKMIKTLTKVNLSGLLVSYLSQGWIIECLQRLKTNDYHEKALEQLKSGEKIGAFSLTEPANGSSYNSMQTTSTVDEEGRWTISGAKNYTSNGGIADYFLLATRTVPDNSISLFLLERGMDGFKIEKKNSFLGNQVAEISYLTFDCKQISDKYLLGRKGNGLFMLPMCLKFERIDLALYATLLAETILEDTIAFLSHRGSVEQRILDYQVVRHKLVDMQSKIVMMKRFVEGTMNQIMAKKECMQEILISKINATEMAQDVILQCAKLCGGYGFTEESHIISSFNDIVGLTIGGGANDVLRNALYKYIERVEKSIGGQRNNECEL